MIFLSPRYAGYKIWIESPYHKLGNQGMREFVPGICVKFENGRYVTEDKAIIESLKNSRFCGVDFFIGEQKENLELTPQAKEELTKEKEAVSLASLTCPECGFVAKSEFGLKGHMRKHSE